MKLADIPFYGAYKQVSEMNQQAGLRDLQAMGTLAQLQKQMQQTQTENNLRTLLAQSNGDPEKAMNLVLQSGDVAAAAHLAPLLKVAQEKKKLSALTGLDMNNPDAVERAGVLTGEPSLINMADRMRKQKSDKSEFELLRGNAQLPDSNADQIGISPTEQSAFQAVVDAAKQGKTATVAVDQGTPGIFSTLVNSKYPEIAAQARMYQKLMNSSDSRSIPPSKFMDYQKALAQAESTKLQQEAMLGQKNESSPFSSITDDPLHPGKKVGYKQITGRMEPVPMAPGMESSQVNIELNGEEFIKTLDRPTQTIVKAIAEGRQAIPSGFAAKSPYWQNIMTLVGQYDPTYNAARPAVWKDFMSGATYRNITAANTLISHFATLNKAVDALQNNNLTDVNRLINAITQRTGSPEVINFKTAQEAVATELMRVFRGIGASTTETESWKKKFDDASSPEQLKGTIKEGMELLKGRVDAINDRWNSNMGTDKGFPGIISPSAQKALSTMGLSVTDNVQDFKTIEDAIKAGKKSGDRVTINGQTGTLK